jgi:predicted ribonuclease YlaK
MLLSTVLELAKWPSSGPAVLAIAPTVIQELDALKANPRNPQLQEKARSLVAQIKEFRRRESGIISGSLRFRKLSTWPRRWTDLPGWLDRGHAGDQILATALELSWTSLRSAVTLVTGDDNMQHKAELLTISYVDPEAPKRLWSPVAVEGAVLYRARRKIIFADCHRSAGERFLAVSGRESEIDAHLSTGAVEVA